MRECAVLVFVTPNYQGKRNWEKCMKKRVYMSEEEHNFLSHPSLL